MTDDIKVLLDQASSASPLKAFDIDTVVRRGRDRARRRRLGLAGGGLVGVAALTAATVGLSSVIAPQTGSAPAQVGTQPPAKTYTLPELDPSETYHWRSYDGGVDDATAAELTDALQNYVVMHFPQLRVIKYGPEEETFTNPDGSSYTRDKARLLAPDDEQSPFRVSRYTSRLVTESGQIVHEQPVYRFRYPGAVNEDTLDVWSGLDIAVDGSGADQIDLLRFALYPAGGFRTGYDPAQDGERHAVNGYLVKGCDTYDVTDAHEGTTEDDRRFSFDCTESTGPNGEQIVAVALHETYLEGDLTITFNTVVVHRTDGTAVVVGDTPRPGFNWRHGQPTSATTSGLSIEALTGLALAVPIVPIG